jgi:hypothetical protein
MSNEPATLIWETVSLEANRTLIIDKPSGLYRDITFRRRAESISHNRAYLTGIENGEWRVMIEVDGQVTRIASGLYSEEAAMAHAQVWERSA